MATQSEQITDRLRRMLLEGTFWPGTHLQEVALAARLAVSRTPVRQALANLAQEGLLVYKPQRGFLVRAFSLEEVVDAIRVRGELEAMACRILGERGGPLPVKIGEGLERMARLVGAGVSSAEDRRDFAIINSDFHAVLLSESGNTALIGLARRIGAMPLVGPESVGPVLEQIDDVQALFEASLAEHEAIVSALSARQSGRAEALMREHLYRAGEAVRGYVDAAGGGGAGFLRLISAV